MIRQVSKVLLILVVTLSDRPPPETPATYEAILPLLRSAHSVEELVPLLPGELRANFTFIYATRGPHTVSREAPRVVLFSDDARLVLALAENSVEIIHFNDRRAAFEMRKFVLPEREGNGALDPPHCLHCHGDDPRPIFDAYPFWPGFYGSVLDTFPAGSPELADYRRFLANGAKQGVYRDLIWRRGTSVPPYLDPKDYRPEVLETGPGGLAHSPNTRLGMALTELNRKRVQRKLAASPDYPRYRYALASGLLGCSALPIPPGRYAEVRAQLTSERAALDQRLGYQPDVRPPDFQLGFTVAAAQIDYLGRALGLSRGDWSLAMERDSFAWFDGILSGARAGRNFYLKEDFLLELLADLAASDREIHPFYGTWEAFGARPFGHRLDLPRALKGCDLLRRREEGVRLP